MRTQARIPASWVGSLHGKATSAATLATSASLLQQEVFVSVVSRLKVLIPGWRVQGWEILDVEDIEDAGT